HDRQSQFGGRDMRVQSGRISTKWLAVVSAVLVCCAGLSPPARAQGAPTYNFGWMRLGQGIAFNGGDATPVWSPDGNRVAIIRLRAVSVVNANTGMLEWIYTCPGDWGAAVFLTNST